MSRRGCRIEGNNNNNVPRVKTDDNRSICSAAVARVMVMVVGMSVVIMLVIMVEDPRVMMQGINLVNNNNGLCYLENNDVRVLLGVAWLGYTMIL